MGLYFTACKNFVYWKYAFLFSAGITSPPVAERKKDEAKTLMNKQTKKQQSQITEKRFEKTKQCGVTVVFVYCRKKQQ